MKEVLPRMLLFLLIILKVFGLTDSCSFFQTGLSLIVDCHNQDLTSVPSNLPTGVTQLRMENNLITTLDQSDFPQYRSMTHLDLENNRIAMINSQAFHNLSDLTSLDLNGNRLSSLSSDMFTGLENLQTLSLYNNEINDIQTGTFSSKPQLGSLYLYQNKLRSLRSDLFTGLGNLRTLELYNNEINDIQAGTFSSTPQLRTLYLHQNRLALFKAEIFASLPLLRHLRLYSNNIETFPMEALSKLLSLSELLLQDNQMMTLPSSAYNKLASISAVNISNNTWQCDCRMVPFRQQMGGSHSFENQITCEGPSNFTGQNLQHLTPQDLTSVCEKPTILRFERVHTNTVLEGETLHLVCETSGIPTPDITVFLPSGSGLNATVESGGRVTVEENGTITITNVTAADTGLYICIAANDVGSTSATLSVVDTHTTSPDPVTSPLTATGASNKPTSNSESTDTFSLPVLIGSVCGAVVGTAILVTIILATWQKKRSKISHLASKSRVAFNNTNPTAAVTISSHDQARHGYVEADEEEYEDVVTPSRRRLAGADLDQRSIEHEYEVIPPFLPPRNISSPPADDQNESSAAQAADTAHGVMDEDEDEYESVKDDPQSHKYENSEVIAAAQDALAVSPVILYDNDDESETGKDDPQSHKYENSEVIAAAQDALAVPPVILYDNDYESGTGKGDHQHQPHKHENSLVTAAAQDAETVVEVIMDDYLSFVVTEKDKAQSNNKYQNSQMIAAAKDAVAVPQVISYENDNESGSEKEDPQSHKYNKLAAAQDGRPPPVVSLNLSDDGTADNQTQADSQNEPAAVHGADTPNHYQHLRNETLEQQHTYTSLYDSPKVFP